MENSDHGADKEEGKKWEAARVLAVGRALLDVVLSVAASVIFSLLLISGDVEENPGPGGSYNDLPAQSDIPYVDGIVLCIDIDYNSVDAAQILGRLSINITCMWCMTW